MTLDLGFVYAAEEAERASKLAKKFDWAIDSFHCKATSMYLPSQHRQTAEAMEGVLAWRTRDCLQLTLSALIYGSL